MKKKPWFDDIKKYYVFRSLNKRFLVPVWAVVMLDAGLSIEQIAFIAMLAAILGLVMEVPSGAISDTLGHKRTLVLAMIGQGSAMLFFAGGSFWWFLAASLTYGGMGTFMTGTHSALFYERLVEMGEGSNFRKYLGRARTVSSAWSLLMVALAGVVYAVSPNAAFLIGAGLFWVGAMVVSTMTQAKRTKSVEKLEGFSALFSHFNSALKTLASDKRLFWLTLSSSAIFGVFMAIVEVQQIIFDNVGILVGLFGFIYAAKRGTAMVFSLVVDRWTRTFTPVMTLIVILALTLAYLIGFGVTDNHTVIILLSLTTPFVIVIQSTVIGDFINQLIPTGSRATTLSMKNFMSGIVRVSILGSVTVLTYFISLELAHIVIAALLVVFCFYLLPMTARAYR